MKTKSTTQRGRGSERETQLSLHQKSSLMNLFPATCRPCLTNCAGKLNECGARK